VHHRSVHLFWGEEVVAEDWLGDEHASWL